MAKARSALSLWIRFLLLMTHATSEPSTLTVKQPTDQEKVRAPSFSPTFQSQDLGWELVLMGLQEISRSLWSLYDFASNDP